MSNRKYLMDSDASRPRFPWYRKYLGGPADVANTKPWRKERRREMKEREREGKKKEARKKRAFKTVAGQIVTGNKVLQ